MNKNSGMSIARNLAINNARGKYIAYLDDDDFYFPNHLETLVNFFKANKNCKVAYTNAYRIKYNMINGRYIEQDKTLINNRFTKDRMLVVNFIPILCVMHEISCLNEVGLFDESLQVLEDWDLWIRLSRKYHFFHIQKATCGISWREDGSSTTTSRRADFYKHNLIIRNKYENYYKNKSNVLKEIDIKQKMNLKVSYEILLNRINYILDSKTNNSDIGMINIIERDIRAVQNSENGSKQFSNSNSNEILQIFQWAIKNKLKAMEYDILSDSKFFSFLIYSLKVIKNFKDLLFRKIEYIKYNLKILFKKT